MKHLHLISAWFVLLMALGVNTTQLTAQSNLGFKYQAVIRDADGEALKEVQTDVRFSITNANEETFYSEIHLNIQSNEFGILGLQVGGGDVEEGSIESLIDLDWSRGDYSLSVELDIQDDESPGWVLYGTSPILTVPYAMYAERVLNSDDADADASNELQELSFENNVLSISNGNSVTIDIENTDEQVLSLAGTNLSITGGNTVNLAPVLSQNGDPSSSNEIQTLTLDGNRLSISGEGGNEVELPEQTPPQRLEISGNELSISDGNSVTLNTVVTENRTDEIQQLEIIGDQLSISGDGGNTITLPTAEGIAQTLDYDPTTNKVTLSNGGGEIDLSDLQDGNGTGTGTDDQTINLNGNILEIEDGNDVDLAEFRQELTFDDATNELAISGGNAIIFPVPNIGDPTDEIQELSYDAANYIVRLNNGGGEVDLSNLKDNTGTNTGTDDQTLSLNGTLLEIEDGNDVDLSAFEQDITYDETSNELSITGGSTITLNTIGGNPTDEIQELEYDAANFRVILSNGGGEIDLSNLKDSGGTGVGTDDQTLSLNGTVLEIEDGNDVDLSDFHQEISYDDVTNELSIADGNTITLPVIGGNPTDEIQELSYDAANHIVRLTNGGGEIDLSNLKDNTGTGTGTDDQTLSLNGTTLEIEDGNDVDLSQIITDDQEITTAELIGTDLNLAIENGNSVTVDMSSLGGGTDDQTIDRAELDNTDLILSIEDGNEVRVDLSSLGGTGGDDDQQLSYDATNNELSLDDGGSVDLSDLAEDADADPENEIQTLSIDGNRLTISGTSGNTINLPTGQTTGSTALLIDEDADTQVYLEEGDLDEVKIDIDGDSLAVFKRNAAGDPMLEFYSQPWVNPANGNISKTRNTYVGNHAGEKSYGTFNSFFGDLAGSNNEVGSDNTFIGSFAGHNNKNGFGNTLIGSGAGSDIEEGSVNIAIGSGALFNSATVDANVIIGSGAGNSLAGNGNVIIGDRAGSGYEFSNSIIIGKDHFPGFKTLFLPTTRYDGDNILSIGNDSTALILGDMSNGRIALGYKSLAEGAYSVAAGLNNRAIGENSIAIGKSSTSSGRSTIAIGESNTVDGFNTFSIGSDNVVNGELSFAIGAENVTSDVEGSMAIGFVSESTGVGSLTLGVFNKAIGNFSMAFGEESTARGHNSIAIGKFNNALAQNSIAIGNDCSTTFKWAIAMGDSTTAEAEHAVALGNKTVAGGINSFAVGGSARTGGNASVAMGLFTEATESYALAFGNRSNALGEGSFAGGLRNVAEGRGSVALGEQSSAEGWAALAIGFRSSATKYGSVALGLDNIASGLGSVALGSGNKPSGESSFAAGLGNETGSLGAVALGEGNNAAGQASVALGINSECTSSYSVAIGQFASSSGLGSVAIGSNVTASGGYSTALGRRVSTNGNYGAFIIGDGNELSNPTLSQAENQFVARFQNGYWFMTSSDQTRTGVFARGGDNAWSGISDINRKENFQLMNDEATLDKLARVDYSSWNYKGQDPSKFRHYGIVAQDFFKHFGEDEYGTIGVDTLVNPLDMMGVSMSAIKGAAMKINKIQDLDQSQQDDIDLLKTELIALKAENNNLKTKLENMKSLEARLDMLESSINESLPINALEISQN